MNLFTPACRTFCCLIHIYWGFIGKVSTLTELSLDAGYEDYLFLDQAVANLSMVLIPSSLTPSRT